MNILEMLASGLLNYSRSEPEGLLARGLRQPAGLLGRGLNTIDRGLGYTPAQGLLADQQRMFNPSVMDTPQDRAELGRRVVQNTFTGPLGLAPIGWTAYHGSPHKFDKFSMDKIGTGEGKQAFGHGLYYADHPFVAKTYATPEATYQRLSGHMDPMQEFAFDLYSQGRSAEDVASAMYQRYIKSNPTDEVMDAVLAADTAARKAAKSGHLYKVDIDDARAPKEAFLDWDKPLSQQPHVMKAIEKTDIAAIGKNGLGWKGAPDGMWEKAIGNKTGEWLYRELLDNNPVATSNKLRELGIPGIRYLDAGSRANGGTYNTVLFDDSLVKILSRE